MRVHQLLALGSVLLPLQVLAVGTSPRGLERIDPAAQVQFEREKKVAVVVGVSAYPEVSGLRPLDYAADDARALSKVLKAQGYLVKTLVNGNATRGGIRKTLLGAGKTVARGEGTVVFAFSGHGFARAGENYLATFETTDTEIEATGLALSQVESLLKASGARRQVMFIDACRNNPTGGKASPGGDVFERFGEAEGLAILYSTAFGELSHETSALGHGVFTHFLLQGLQGEAANAEGLITFGLLAGYVQEGVGDWTFQHLTAVQRPYVGGEYYRDFLLAEVQRQQLEAPRPVVSQTLPLTVQTSPEGARVRILNIRAKYEDGIRLKPGKYRIEVTHPEYEKHVSWFNVTKENSVYAVELEAVPKPRPSVSQVQAPQTVKTKPEGAWVPPRREEIIRLARAGFKREMAVEYERRAGAALVPEMVSIRGGCFQMGSPSFISAFFTRQRRDKERDKNERQHQVCVEDFAIGKYEVTNREYWRFRPQHSVGSSNDSYDDRPVNDVSWDDAVAYAEWLSRKTGKRYRLPTEAEWEYACRGGRRGERYCGGDDIEALAWYDGNSGGRSHAVGGKRENGFGLYDMSGNVWEFTCSVYDKVYAGGEERCADQGDSGKRVARGGASSQSPWNHRSASRVYPRPDRPAYGFRLAQDR